MPERKELELYSIQEKYGIRLMNFNFFRSLDFAAASAVRKENTRSSSSSVTSSIFHFK
jgi:hypothetical protein